MRRHHSSIDNGRISRICKADGKNMKSNLIIKITDHMANLLSQKTGIITSRLFFLMIICTGILFSSCSRLKNISVSKRHYRSGYYVDFGFRKQGLSNPKGTETNSALTSASVSNDTEKKEEISNPLGVQPPVFTDAVNKRQKEKQKRAVNTFASTTEVSKIPADTKDESISINPTYQVYVNPAVDEKSSSSAPMWAIILFAILIPPLGVALKFGIVDKFWISLLLTLLFWLPGAIYSVIVVTE